MVAVLTFYLFLATTLEGTQTMTSPSPDYDVIRGQTMTSYPEPIEAARFSFLAYLFGHLDPQTISYISRLFSVGDPRSFSSYLRCRIGLTQSHLSFTSSSLFLAVT